MSCHAITLVQMSREFEALGRAAEASRVMGEACEELGKPIRQTASPQDLTWGAWSRVNLVRRETLRSRQAVMADPNSGWRAERISGSSWDSWSPFDGIDRIVDRRLLTFFDESMPMNPAVYADLIRRVPLTPLRDRWTKRIASRLTQALT